MAPEAALSRCPSAIPAARGYPRSPGRTGGSGDARPATGSGPCWRRFPRKASSSADRSAASGGRYGFLSYRLTSN
ncbi:hypothetical protein ebA4198 [Aromatoleum aromaticum EbN1]|uniref:Uncharacterized protein n=1 Tax=Aromatoleum aromaticum (strain DSM 19018 / LMG 30748 / EbN1) TaxID=76114 RepID=Q5P2G4_AROAE|nr:hypothetical protein ebA4198 [Aromatoleum aromaticum EbN1]